jgi:DNA-binding transcriptional LysR family regulator
MGIKNFKISFSGGTIASTLAILTGSNALTILPFSVVYTAPKSNNIAALPIHVEHPDRTLGMVTRRGATLPPAIARAHQFLELRFRKLADEIPSGREVQLPLHNNAALNRRRREEQAVDT